MKGRILNSLVIFIIGISFSACNKKEMKPERSFSAGDEKYESQFTDSDIINNSNTKEEIETKINCTDSEKNKWINEILEYNTRGGGRVYVIFMILVFFQCKKRSFFY